MKNKILLPILLLATMTMVACNQGKKSEEPKPGPDSSEVQPVTSEEQPVSSEEPQPSSEAPQPSSETPVSSEDPVVYGVAINNKAQLTGEWYKGTTRDLDITLTPAANALQEISKGNLTITSSNPEIVAVTGLGMNALGKGAAKITVKYHDAVDTVDVNILSNSAIDKYGTAHEGTAADPFTNEDALLVAKSDKYEQEDYYVKGEIASWYHTPGERSDGKVSWFLKPATAGGEQFEIYQCLKEDGSALTDNDVWKGGTAVAHGTFTKYNNQYETTSAKFLSCEGNKPTGPRGETAATVAEALTAGKALVDGDSEWNYFVITGYVVKQSGTNFFLSDTKTAASNDKDMFEIYSAKAEGLDAKLLKNAKITIKAVIKNYHGQVETCLPVTNESVTVLQAGEPWVINYQEKTVAEALAIIAGLTTDNEIANGYYSVTGYIVSIDTAWSTQYNNISFKLGATADAIETLTVFRAGAAEGTDGSKLAAGDKVTVKGQLQKYVKNGATTPEVINAATTLVQAASGGEGGEGGDTPVVEYQSVGSLSFNKDTTVVVTDSLSDATDPKINYASTSGVSIDVRKNTSSSNVNVWKSDYSSCRWYVGHKVTIASSNDFVKIVLTCDSGYSSFKAEAEGSTIKALKDAGITYASENNVITLVLPAAVKTFDLVPDKQIRPSNVEIFAVKGGETPATNEAMPWFTTGEGNQAIHFEGAGIWTWVNYGTMGYADFAAFNAAKESIVAAYESEPAATINDKVVSDDIAASKVCRVYIVLSAAYNTGKLTLTIPGADGKTYEGTLEFNAGALAKVNGVAL